MGDYSYSLYQALQSFTPASNDQLALPIQKHDVLEISVESPFSSETASLHSHSQRNGWLYAYNRRTGLRGYVPVEVVKLLGSQINNTIHHPSALGVEVGMQESEFSSKSSHRFTEVYVLTPIFCLHCKDYIWGTGKVGVRCTSKLFFNRYF